MTTDLELAKQVFQAQGSSFVLVKDGRVLASGTLDGIGELLTAVERLDGEAHGASLADRIVGKAVALLAAHARIRAVYSPLASEAARRILTAWQIELTADRTVPLILNKRSDGPCPMERLTMTINEPQIAVRALKEFVANRESAIAQPRATVNPSPADPQ